MKPLFATTCVLYPLAIFLLIVVFEVPVRVVSLAVVVMAAVLFLVATAPTTHSTRKSATPNLVISAVLLAVLGILCLITKKSIFLRMYPVTLMVVLLAAFSVTLAVPPNICYRFACIADKRISGSAYAKSVESYCKRVTVAWCVFFVFNGIVAAFTAFYNFGTPALNNRVWSVYNGGVSYAIMLAIFVVEGIIRHFKDKSMLKLYPVTKFNSNSWSASHIVCFSGTFSNPTEVKTFSNLLADTATLRDNFNKSAINKYVVHIDDYYLFLCAFIALLQCNKEIHLVQNTSQEFLKEVLLPGMTYLTDNAISNILQSPVTPNDPPTIDAATTKIFLYTSGSTGHPKQVLQRMIEFELDNSFVASNWNSDIATRRFISTVSAHHIYGLLYSVLLPFTLGVPFCRNRIESPDNFEKFTDTSYTIITTPSFLKRLVQSYDKLNLITPFIFTSGGSCSNDLAKKVASVIGTYPTEVYGSSETSGIAYRRQDLDGELYTPFSNAQIAQNNDGCLVVKSPYIADPAGFVTSDLVDIMPNGKFRLLGRIDEVVKIEEKRISLTEVERRLIDTGLVDAAKVIKLASPVREYLAAAVVLNSRALNQFSNSPKYQINKYFHDALMQSLENVTIPKAWRFINQLPCDTQGKVLIEEVQKLFARP